MKKIEKPWGYELVWAHTENYVGKQIFIKGGERLSLQYHEEKEESILVTHGKLGLELDGDKSSKQMIELSPGDSYHITPKTVHRMIALDDEMGYVVLVEVSTTQLNDVVRLEDDYGRAGVKDVDYEDELPTDVDNKIPSSR